MASIATAMKAVLTPEEIWKTVEGMSSLIRAETGRSSVAARRSVLALAHPVPGTRSVPVPYLTITW